MAKLEVRLEYAIFPAAKFFTDDIVISSTCKDQLSALISSFYDGLDIKFLASKNFMMTNAQMLIGWIGDDSTIEEVLEAEYLGVQNEVDWCIRVPSATWLVFFLYGRRAASSKNPNHDKSGQLKLCSGHEIVESYDS